MSRSGTPNPSESVWLVVKTLDEHGQAIPLGRFQDSGLCERFRQEVKQYPNYRDRPVWVDVEENEAEKHNGAQHV